MTRALIIVPCHGIFIGSDPFDVNQWLLESWQKYDLIHYIEHVKKGLELQRTEAAVLVFSGGRTKPQCDRSEAAGYLAIASILSEPDPIHDVLLEEHARDSFENVFFSICRFYQSYMSFPANIQVVGFPFKQKRFTQLHFPTIKELIAPYSKKHRIFKYHSVTLDSTLTHQAPPWLEDVEDEQGHDTAFPLFQACPLGNTGALLVKRQTRHPTGALIPYSTIFPPPWSDLFK